MGSPALRIWEATRLPRLRELATVYLAVAESDSAREWGTAQLSRSRFVVLVAEFQGYCRDLHDAASQIHLERIDPSQRKMVGRLLRETRALQRRNPSRSAIGADFMRLDIHIVLELQQAKPESTRQLDRLDRLIGYRNAIVHGDDAGVAQMETSDDLRPTADSYGKHADSIGHLVARMDAVVSATLSATLEMRQPW